VSRRVERACCGRAPCDALARDPPVRRPPGPDLTTAVFQPDCTPPMTLVYSNVVLTDETNNLVHRF
jgi:hypothetical protein